MIFISSNLNAPSSPRREIWFYREFLPGPCNSKVNNRHLYEVGIFNQEKDTGDRSEKWRGVRGKGSEEEVKFIHKGTSVYKHGEVENAGIFLLMKMKSRFSSSLLKGIYHIHKRSFTIARWYCSCWIGSEQELIPPNASGPWKGQFQLQVCYRGRSQL